MVGQIYRAMLDNTTALSATSFTQLYDTEMELDGILTYDRQRAKLDIGELKRANQHLINGAILVRFSGANGTASS